MTEPRKRFKIVTPEAISRPDPAILDALDAMTREAQAAVPVGAMLVYESADGDLTMRSYPDSPSLRLGMIEAMFAHMHGDVDE